jgi:CBS domain-containing protein
MFAQEILRVKRTEVHRWRSWSASQVMQPTMVGIITKSDLLRAPAADNAPLDESGMRRVMST